VVWGYLASSFRRPWLWVAAGLLLIFIPLSRIYLGVHFPTDLLGGYVLGAILPALPPRQPLVEGWLKMRPSRAGREVALPGCSCSPQPTTATASRPSALMGMSRLCSGSDGSGSTRAEPSANRRSASWPAWLSLLAWVLGRSPPRSSHQPLAISAVRPPGLATTAGVLAVPREGGCSFLWIFLEFV
jgi:hypothetical protein